MMDGADVFKKILHNVHDAVQKDKYRIAAMESTDFIRLACNLKSENEVFIGEVLESICMQIHQIINAYDVPDEEVLSITNKLSEHINNIIQVYENQQDVCNILKSIRYDATLFQFDAPKKFDRKQRSRIENR